MVWKETSIVIERERFVSEIGGGLYNMSELCERFGVSRKTGYKWRDRFWEYGPEGLVDRSRAPHSCPHRMSDEAASLVFEVRRVHPTWGAGKILDWLVPRLPDVEFPAPSTAGDFLDRCGLVKHRARRRQSVHPGVVPAASEKPNDLWTADFKGQFRTKDKVYCYPLTIADLDSRYLLCCQGLLSTGSVGAQKVFERVFREYGLPRAIRTDNGVPFATTGFNGLSSLNVWWMRLGIIHQRIHPASPQENGAHERMHRTLKAEVTRPPKSNLRQQQKAFDAFQKLYNEERPHDSLDGEPPGSRYRSSRRPYPDKLPPLEYPEHFRVKRVTEGGTVRLQRGRLLYVSTALTSHPIGLEEVEDGIWSVYFGNTLLGRVDERESVLR